MFEISSRLTELSLQHRHNDGSWSDLKLAPHDAAQLDPERHWGHAEVFTCTACGEQVRVAEPAARPDDGDTT